MTLHFTGTLRKKLHLPDPGPSLSVPAPQDCWYAKVFTAQRVQYIVTANAACLFSVVMPGRGISDGDRYLKEFLRELMQHLEALGMEDAYPTLRGPGDVSFGMVRATDQSVVQSVNHLAARATWWMARRGLGPREATEGLNDMSLKTLGYRTPKETLVRMVLDGATHDA